MKELLSPESIVVGEMLRPDATSEYQRELREFIGFCRLQILAWKVFRALSLSVAIASLVLFGFGLPSIDLNLLLAAALSYGASEMVKRATIEPLEKMAAKAEERLSRA